MKVHNMKRLWELGHGCQFIVSKVQVCQFCEFLQEDKNVQSDIRSTKCLPQFNTRKYLTLKAFAFTPWVLSLLLLASNEYSLVGSVGSLVSLFSARLSSSRWGSFEKAPSSISVMRFPVRSILLNVAVTMRAKKEPCLNPDIQRLRIRRGL